MYINFDRSSFIEGPVCLVRKLVQRCEYERGETGGRKHPSGWWNSLDSHFYLSCICRKNNEAFCKIRLHAPLFIEKKNLTLRMILSDHSERWGTLCRALERSNTLHILLKTGCCPLHSEKLKGDTDLSATIWCALGYHQLIYRPYPRQRGSSAS